MAGKINLFLDPNGVGERQEIGRGAIFGEKHFRLGDESMLDAVGGAAQCEEPCVIGVLGTEVLEAPYADRAFGNRKIALSMRHAPALSRVVLPEGFVNGKVDFASLSFAEKTKLLEADRAAHSVIMVSKGSIEVRGDIKLTERLDVLPPKKKRMRIFLDRAEKLAGDSIFDKLDPYCIVKLGEFKRFQTPVMWNVGVNPQFEYQGELEIIVMDYDKFSADDLCGSCTVKVSDLYDGWYGKVDLMRPKRSLGAAKDDEHMLELAGRLYFGVKYDYEKISALTKKPKEKSWPDQVGQELTNFRIFGGYQRGGANEKIVLLKASKKRFMDFVKKSQKEKQFLQSCRLSTLDKQVTIKGIIKSLIERWETEDQTENFRKGVFQTKVVEAVDPSRFRVAYRGAKALVTVRNALNLSGGGWFDKLDPYAILRFRGSKAEFSTFAAMKFRTTHALTESSLPSLPLPCAQERVFFKMLAAIPFGIAKAICHTAGKWPWKSQFGTMTITARTT
eukprot:g28270.t1